MTEAVSNEERRRYREWMNRLMGIGVVGFMSAVVAAIFAPESVSERFLFAGLAVYYLGVFGYLAIWRVTGVRLFDERERQIERRTGHVITLIVLFVTIFGLPADLLLDTTNVIAVPPVLRGVIWGCTALSFVGMFVYGYIESQYS